MNITGFLTLTERECRRFLRVWQQTIIPPVITSLLFILIFGYSLGSQISEIAGVSYLEFIEFAQLYGFKEISPVAGPSFSSG